MKFSTQILRLARPQLLSYSPRTFTPFAFSVRTMSSEQPTTPVGDIDGGPITSTIISKLQSTFNPTYLAIYNDSRFHAHHAEQRHSSNKIESHFRVELVSDQFDGKGMPARHRLVYKALEDEMAMQNGVHALSLKTKTPQEWEKIKNK